MIVPGILVCSSFLISVCMFIVSKALLTLSAWGAIWLNPFATVLFNVCSAVTVECLVCLLLCQEKGSSPVSLQLLREGIWACMRYNCLCLCWVLG